MSVEWQMRDMRRERCWRENEERRGGEDRKEMVTADLRMLGVTDWRKASHEPMEIIVKRSCNEVNRVG
jgi:hypothetical protein